jgi:hypothetical protein
LSGVHVKLYRAHQIREKRKRVALPHLASFGNGEDSFGEALSVAGVFAEAGFEALNGGLVPISTKPLLAQP